MFGRYAWFGHLFLVEKGFNLFCGENITRLSNIIVSIRGLCCYLSVAVIYVS